MIFSEARFARKLLAWYDQNRRNLPWRLPRDAASDARLDPYLVLVSEFMLQQTQVATVVPYFRRFIKQFPTIRDLAGANEQQVLRVWQGLGYYSRARNLQKSAKQIVEQHGCELPANVQELMNLPGVGRYTAGAIASLAFGVRAPILDGNVARVLCRLDRIESDPREPRTRERLWARAEAIMPKRSIVGDFNSALMELGATVCTPRNPQCPNCPVRDFCEARRAGKQERIPPARSRAPNPVHRRSTFCIESKGRWLIEQRPCTGRWAGMWQFVTVDADGKVPSRAKKLVTIQHELTHRRYEFDVYHCRHRGRPRNGAGRKWVTLDELAEYPIPRPHLRIAELLRNLG